jgi:hypothetical protein
MEVPYCLAALYSLSLCTALSTVSLYSDHGMPSSLTHVFLSWNKRVRWFSFVSVCTGISVNHQPTSHLRTKELDDLNLFTFSYLGTQRVRGVSPPLFGCARWPVSTSNLPVIPGSVRRVVVVVVVLVAARVVLEELVLVGSCLRMAHCMGAGNCRVLWPWVPAHTPHAQSVTLLHFFFFFLLFNFLWPLAKAYTAQQPLNERLYQSLMTANGNNHC